MDGGASVIIPAPILTLVAVALGISTVHFGIIMALNLTIGNITLPLGYCLFIGSRIGEINVEKGIQAQAEQSCKNVGAILKEAGMDFSCVCKTTCFLADMEDLQSLMKYMPAKHKRQIIVVIPAAISYTGIRQILYTEGNCQKYRQERRDQDAVYMGGY